MTRGIAIFAFNSDNVDYFKMAEFTANRISHFLDLPVTVITDEKSLSKNHQPFDRVIMVDPNRTNIKQGNTWLNKGRYLAYDLSPYDHTILIDVDYMINSSQLLNLFELNTDFACHKDIAMLGEPEFKDEYLSGFSYKTLWATVLYFQKTKRAKQIFEAMKMVQENYLHYARLHHFVHGCFRNDYALTLALKIANGHLDVPSDYIPWKLIHASKNVHLVPDTTEQYNVSYRLYKDVVKANRTRKEYMVIEEHDFHMMSKHNFKEIMR